MLGVAGCLPVLGIQRPRSLIGPQPTVLGTANLPQSRLRARPLGCHAGGPYPASPPPSTGPAHAPPPRLCASGTSRDRCGRTFEGDPLVRVRPPPSTTRSPPAHGMGGPVVPCHPAPPPAHQHILSPRRSRREDGCELWRELSMINDHRCVLRGGEGVGGRHQRLLTGGGWIGGRPPTLEVCVFSRQTRLPAAGAAPALNRRNVAAAATRLDVGVQKNGRRVERFGHPEAERGTLWGAPLRVHPGCPLAQASTNDVNTAPPTSPHSKMRVSTMVQWLGPTTVHASPPPTPPPLPPILVSRRPPLPSMRNPSTYAGAAGGRCQRAPLATRRAHNVGRPLPHRGGSRRPSPPPGRSSPHPPSAPLARSPTPPPRPPDPLPMSHSGVVRRLTTRPVCEDGRGGPHRRPSPLGRAPPRPRTVPPGPRPGTASPCALRVVTKGRGGWAAAQGTPLRSRPVCPTFSLSRLSV